ncbi:hypothetical protein EDB83DRAFT_2516002 [Lactarius deliciosus]|nr:hypothetical protein EDB83DRAFT_2516002 [Lactarius deliciosus]
MSTANNTATETKAAAAAPETQTHHHGGIIGKVENVFHSISTKLHAKHDKPLHPESDKEHRERAGTIGELQELGTTHPEAEVGFGTGGTLGGPGAGPAGLGGPPRTL